MDGEPEDGEDGSRDDGNVGAPEAPGGAGDDGEGHVVEDTDCTIKSDDEGDDEEGEGDNAEGFAPCQTLVVLINVREWVETGGSTNCDDTGRKLPCRSAGIVLAS